MDKYCISYTYATTYETEWFNAASRKDAIQRVKDIVGVDIKIEHLIMRPDQHLIKSDKEKIDVKISRRKRKRDGSRSK